MPKFNLSKDPDFNKMLGSFDQADGLPPTPQPGDIAAKERVNHPQPGGLITLHSGKTNDKKSLIDWSQEPHEKSTVYLRQHGEDGSTRTLQLHKAQAQRISLAKTTRSDGNEVAVDTIEIVHEGLTIKNS